MKLKSKTVLFIMPRLPFPATSGRKNSLYHYCRILSQELQCRLVVAAFLEKGDKIEYKPDFVDRLEILPKASTLKRIVTIIKKSLIKKFLPLQASLYWSEDAKKIIDRIIEDEKPDVVIGDMIRCTEYIKNVNSYRVADLDDRISLRYQRQLDRDIEGINPYGAFLNTVPGIFRKLLLLQPIKTFVMRNEIELLHAYELGIGKCCDCVVFVAAKEVEEFNKEIGENKAIAVPIGVDVDYFNYRKCGNGNNIIGFLGAMNVSHNESAVKHFIKNIFPLIQKDLPDAKFMVIGGGVSAELSMQSSEHIIFTGRVEDVRNYLQQCDVFVCPMTFGSGIKTKNLEAMAMGLPIVTTSIGAENIAANDGYDWYVADTNELFASYIQLLLSDEEKRINMGINGSNFILRNFTWKTTQIQLSCILNQSDLFF